MIPSEIAHIKQSSPTLQYALFDHHAEVWAFLRGQVEVQSDLSTCERCGHTECATHKTPYNAPDTGWCIDCALWGLFNDASYYRTPTNEFESWAWEPPEGVVWS